MNTYLEGGVTFADGSHYKGCHLGLRVLLNKGSFVLNSQIDDESQIGFNTKILYSNIGKFCSISWDCSIGGANHNIRVVSNFNMKGETHYKETSCIIGNDVWVGAGVNVLRDVIVGDGAIIGAGSVVTHNVLPYEIVAGVPAKHICCRFEESIRERLLRIQWWNFPISIIEDNLDLFEHEVSEEVIKRMEVLYDLQHGKE
jgi:acetyltransferase-like isoleucine patch superfamily enzyme